MSNLINFCLKNELKFVPVTFKIIKDDNHEGFYKKSMLPTPFGWKEWTMNKCTEFYENNKSDFILIDLDNKFCVCDCDSKESTEQFTKFMLNKSGESEYTKQVERFTTYGSSHYLTTDKKPIKDSQYKLHFWFKIKDVVPKQKVDTNKKFDVITNHIVERITYEEDIFTHKPKSFGKSLYKFCYGKKYIHEIDEPKFTYDDLTYEQKCIYDSCHKINNTEENKKDMNKIISSIDNQEITYKPLLLFYYNKFISPKSFNYNKANINQNVEMFMELFRLINESHMTNYDDWLKIAFAISSLTLNDADKLVLFGDVSRLSYKYRNITNYECFKVLKNIKKGENKVTIGTIKFWAKDENESGYKSWNEKYMSRSNDNIDESIYLLPSKNWETQTINSRYLPELDIKEGLTLVNSHLGTGKTTLISRFIKQHSEKKIIIITPREIYAQNICAELNKSNLNFTLYQDYKNKNKDRVVCQLESLRKFDDLKYDIVIMDECESILKQCSSFSTHSHNLAYNTETFENIINNSKYVIMADAFPTNRSKEFLDNFSVNKSVHYINNQFNPYERQSVQYPTYFSFCNQIIKSIDSGKKVVVLWGSKKRGLKFVDSKDFTTSMTGKKHLFYHGDRDKKYNESIKDVHSTWSKIDVLMYTTKITVGVNFDMEYFDEIFIYGTPDSAVCRDLFQGSLRVRTLKDNLLHYFIEDTFTYAKNQTHVCDLDEIENQLNANKYKAESYIKDNKINNVDFQNMKPWLKQTIVRNLFEENINKAHYEQVFQKYLQLCGYEKKHQTLMTIYLNQVTSPISVNMRI